MNAEFEAKFRQILSENDDPHDGLIRLVHEWTASGIVQKDMFARFEEFRAILRTEDREADDDSVMDVMDVMDRIVGWCSDHQKLFGVYSADFFVKADQVSGKDNGSNNNRRAG